jgi:molecular chaperone GrpE (heat shock protein)
MHLLSGQPELPDPASIPVPKEAAREALEAEQQRWTEMETTIAELKAELAELRAEFKTFREQFE